MVGLTPPTKRNNWQWLVLFRGGVIGFHFAVVNVPSQENCRVPTAPGKPGKTGPDLENLENQEKQGVGGQNPRKILQNLEKNIDLTPKKVQKPQQKKYLKKNPTQERGPRFFFIYLDKGLGIIDFCWNFKNVVLI